MAENIMIGDENVTCSGDIPDGSAPLDNINFESCDGILKMEMSVDEDTPAWELDDDMLNGILIENQLWNQNNMLDQQFLFANQNGLMNGKETVKTENSNLQAWVDAMLGENRMLNVDMEHKQKIGMEVDRMHDENVTQDKMSMKNCIRDARNVTYELIFVYNAKWGEVDIQLAIAKLNTVTSEPDPVFSYWETLAELNCDQNNNRDDASTGQETQSSDTVGEEDGDSNSTETSTGQISQRMAEASHDEWIHSPDAGLHSPPTSSNVFSKPTTTSAPKMKKLVPLASKRVSKAEKIRSETHEKKFVVNGTEFYCTCGQSFDKRGFGRHKRQMGLEKIITCDTCGNKFYELQPLKKHKRDVHKEVFEGRFACYTYMCGQIFQGRKKLRRHQEKIHKRQSTVGHVKDTSKKDGHFCICGKSCSTHSSLCQHVKHFTLPPKFKCTKCNKKWTTTYLINKHMRTSHGIISNFKNGCRRCATCFPNKSMLLIHQRTEHSKKKKASGPTPGFSTLQRQKDNILEKGLVHQTVESMQIDIGCICGMESASKQHLTLEIGERMFKCTACQECGASGILSFVELQDKRC